MVAAHGRDSQGLARDFDLKDQAHRLRHHGEAKFPKLTGTNFKGLRDRLDPINLPSPFPAQQANENIVGTRIN